MSFNADDPVFPLAGWDIQAIPSHQCILLKADYLSSAMQPVDQPHPGKLYALTEEQAVELAHALLREAQKLGSHGAQRAPDHEPLQ